MVQEVQWVPVDRKQSWTIELPYSKLKPSTILQVSNCFSFCINSALPFPVRFSVFRSTGRDFRNLRSIGLNGLPLRSPISPPCPLYSCYSRGVFRRSCCLPLRYILRRRNNDNRLSRSCTCVRSLHFGPHIRLCLQARRIKRSDCVN